MKLVKLSPMQAEIIRDARDHIVNGRHTRRVVYVRGSKTATWVKLYRLGLINAPHEYADLTEEGVAAQRVLVDDPSARVAQATDSRPGGRPYRLDAAPAQRFTVRVTNGSGSYPMPLPKGTTMGEALASFHENIKLADEGDLVELLADGEAIRHRRKVTVEPMPAAPAIEQAHPGGVHAWAAAGRLPEKFPDADTVKAFIDALLVLWPVDGRVRGMVDGVERTGRIVDSPRHVAEAGHPNYGRVYTDVIWDDVPNAKRHYTGRTRPFVTDVTRL